MSKRHDAGGLVPTVTGKLAKAFPSAERASSTRRRSVANHALLVAKRCVGTRALCKAKASAVAR